ncbi:two-component system response regulator [Solemya pervernicosa gill symbiont]|uniref:Two-component system response regulator n=1 Tax=Solemya pervernicosa gill symbiont TaxID=642797 RepID=A0A1T2LB03_9GAMM|nr:HD domain-containing phosphohydrolase [Solemya pervernicosa gill symbiont]OOZ42234.1 two-component system response regulator [Solemya pervernicosa gill symbiont]
MNDLVGSNDFVTDDVPVLQSATLLFVDDEPNIVSSLRRLFRPLGYKILTANNGEEGLAVLEQNSVDLVVSDMRMPVMDGATFLAKAAERWPDTVRILLTGYADMESTISAINQGKIYKYFSKPWEDNDITLGVKYALKQKFLEQDHKRLLKLTKNQNEELQSLNASLEDRVKARTEELRQAMGMLEVSHETLKGSYLNSVKVFSNIIEMREGSVAGHSRRVAEQAHALAKKCDMSEDDARQVLFAALLHDIGKIGLPDRLMGKPYNALSSTDKVEVMKHPMVGEGLMLSLDHLQDAGKLIRSHHEQFDGNGYPDKLKGKKIPLGARILALVNDYDALQSGMLSTQRLSAVEAREYITRGRGRLYDPEMVDLWLDMQGLLDKRVEEEDSANFLKLTPSECNSGMVLASDLFINDKVLLLSRGHVLTDDLIARLRKLEQSTGERIDMLIRPAGD